MTIPGRIYVVSSVWADGRSTPFIAFQTQDQAYAYIKDFGFKDGDPKRPADHGGYDVSGIALLVGSGDLS